jgi:glycosyltransferase involved in cell wall biosynthesis
MRFVREDSEVSIKVMQIIARMNVGGPAVIVADLMRGLDSQKFNQIIVTGFCDDDEADYLETVATDISATRIAGLGRSISLVSDVRAFFALVALIKSEQPDVIHTHTAKAGVLGRVASIVAGGKAIRIHTFHGHLLHGYFSGWKTALVIAIEKFLAQRTHFLIAVGNQVRDDLLEVGIGSAEKFRTFFPGLPAPHTPTKEECRRELGLDPETTYCTFVGRLTQIKRPDRLLDIAQQMSKSGASLQFLIAGEGDLFEASKARVLREDLPVTFLGWRNDIDLIFAASDIAILTSDNEGIPLTLIQAAQAGLPIVAPRVGSIADIVIDGENGFLTPPNAAEMCEPLARLVRDSTLRKNLGVSGKSRATELFSLEKSMNDHGKLYEFSQHK